MLSTAVTGTTTPSDAMPARCDFPFGRLYAPAAPGNRLPGPAKASPVPVPTICPCRSPYPGEFLGACTFQVFDAFHGLRRDFSGSPLPCPLAGLASRGCRIRLMLRPGQLLPLKGFRRWATKPGVSPRPRQPATGPPGSYPDRTFTGKQTRACRRGSPQQHHLLSEMTGAHVCWAHDTRTRVDTTHSTLYHNLESRAPLIIRQWMAP